MADNIKVDFSIETLEKEAKKTAGSIEPLKVALKDNVVITFQNPQELGVFELLDFSEAGDDANITELLKKILSEDDYAALRDYNPTGTVLGLLMQKVTAHYGVEDTPKAEDRFYLHYAALYRAEVRADLYEVYGVSLAELVTQGRFTELADLLSQLPQSSRFWAAMMEDESYCEMVLDAHLSQDDEAEDEEVPKWAPAYRDYTADYALMAQIYDAINVLNYTTAAVQGAKGVKKPKPLPSPKTGIDKAKERVTREQTSSLYATFGREVPDFDVKVKAE